MGDDRGTISIVAVTGALVLCSTALCAADLGALLLARARAQDAADAAALAAAVELAPVLDQGDDPRDAASDAAARNGGTLVRCDCDVGRVAATVEVVVTPRLAFMRPWFGRE